MSDSAQHQRDRITADASVEALRQTLADVRRSIEARRRMSLPNARRLYLRRAGRLATDQHVSVIAALFRRQ